MSGPARKIDELCQYLIGQSVKVRVRSGKVYTGILHHATTQGGFSVVLKMAKVDSDVFEELPISAPDFSDMQIDDNQPQAAAAPASPAASVASNKADPFKTDSEISGSTNQGEDRALERWDDGMDDPKVRDMLMGLEDDKDIEFDQFKVNERKFGVKSTYHESLDQYTTKLDKNSDWYKERVHSATIKANQIKNAPTNNPHLKEERTGKLLSGDNDDEENRYSAVVRSPNNNNKNNKSTPSQTPPNQSPSSKQQPAGAGSKKYVLPQHRNRGTEEQLTTSAEQKIDRDTKSESEEPQSGDAKLDNKQEDEDAENFVRFKEEATVKKQKKEEIAEFRNFSAEIENKRRTSSGTDREKAVVAQEKKEPGLRATATEFKPQSASTFQPFIPRGGPAPFAPKPVEAGGMWPGQHPPAFGKMGPPQMGYPMPHPGYPPMGPPPRGFAIGPHPMAYPHPPPSGPSFVPHSNQHAPHMSPSHSAPTSQPTPSAPTKPLTLKPTSSTFVPGSGMTFVPGSGLVPTAVAPTPAPSSNPTTPASPATTTPTAGGQQASASPASTTQQAAAPGTEKPQQQ